MTSFYLVCDCWGFFRYADLCHEIVANPPPGGVKQMLWHTPRLPQSQIPYRSGIQNSVLAIRISRLSEHVSSAILPIADLSDKEGTDCALQACELTVSNTYGYYDVRT